MDKRTLRNMILNECSCMAREAELPAAMGAAMPMLSILGYDTHGGGHDNDMDHGDQFEDSDEYEESGMIKNNLFNIAKHAQAMHDALEDGDDLPEWVQEKIAVANSMMSTIYDYLDAETSSMNEARKPWYMKKRRNMKKTNEAEWYDIPKKKSRSVKKKK